jgi:hypothetical protein
MLGRTRRIFSARATGSNMREAVEVESHVDFGGRGNYALISSRHALLSKRRRTGVGHTARSRDDPNYS